MKFESLNAFANDSEKLHCKHGGFSKKEFKTRIVLEKHKLLIEILPHNLSENRILSFPLIKSCVTQLLGNSTQMGQWI